MSIKAALLDEQGIFLGIDELTDAGQLTDQHLPGITECDLPPGRYRWVPTEVNTINPYGGAFWPLPKPQEH
jgi:hypothetical protein